MRVKFCAVQGVQDGLCNLGIRFNSEGEGDPAGYARGADAGKGRGAGCVGEGGAGVGGVVGVSCRA